MGDNNQVRAGAGALLKGAGHIEDARNELRTLATNMEANLSAMATQFVGSGGTAFQAFKTAWMERQNNVVKILDVLSQAIRDTASRQTDADEAVKASFDKLGVTNDAPVTFNF